MVPIVNDVNCHIRLPYIWGDPYCIHNRCGGDRIANNVSL